jgi:DNA-binding response OmpR family regulator
MSVDVAYDGLEAAGKLDLTPYDVVVLDRDLPGIHGDKLCQMRVSRHRCGQGENAIVVLSRIFVPGTGFASRARVDRASERMS